MTNLRQTERQKAVRLLFIILVGVVIPMTWYCQWRIFTRWDDFAQSILIGTCMSLFGGFAAVLASPYGTEDEKRLSRVSTTVITLVTGYALAKIIDPLVTQIMGGTRLFLDMKKGTNLLIGVIGFLAGFLGTYGYRAYLGMDIFQDGVSSQDGTRNVGTGGGPSQALTADGAAKNQTSDPQANNPERHSAEPSITDAQALKGE